VSLSPPFLDELRSRTLLSGLVGRTLKITKAGREFKGCCPFHNEKTPSFYVNDEKGFYHCFGCSAHGDAISWMTDQRGLGFMDAVKELADAAGMEVPAADPRAAERAERGTALYDVMAAAQSWFVEQLGGIEGADARAYLEKRGLNAATIKTFGIGFAPDSKSKLKAALARFGAEKLVDSGLLISVEDKEPYDRFRGRLMIPIRDPRGRVIAFGGRILGAGEPKYLNSPDTPLFDKGRTLYNLDLAGPESRKSARMIVVEGYMDVIALAQAGIADAVAPLGTALTEHQLERLWRMTERPLLCFDGDSAGQKAAFRGLVRALPALKPTRSLRFVTLPPGQDPDDLVKSGGRAAMDTLIEQAVSLVDRLWAHEMSAAPLATPEARAGLKRRLMDHAQTIDDKDVRSHYALEFNNRIDALFRAQAPAARNRNWRLPPERPTMESTRTLSGSGVEPALAQAILSGLIRHPHMILACAEPFSIIPFSEKAHDQLRHVLLDAAFDHAELDSEAIIAICDSAGLGSLTRSLKNAKRLSFSFNKPLADAEVAQRDLIVAIEALAARPVLDAAVAAATAGLADKWEETGYAEQQRLLEARRDADQKLATLASGDDRDV
jgi:DNA primase